jgi:glycosyltransferase involved in cell wall biosynthesis
VNTDLYRPLPRDNVFTKEHSLDSQFVISYVGNLGNAQDFSPVLSAAVACRDIPVKFLLVGSGIKEKLLAEEIASKKLDNIKLIGYQPRELTPMINAASDICLVLLSPHVRNYSFPSKIYALMACGKPILLYGHTGADAARFVHETGIGWVVENGDINGFIGTIRHLYDNRPELEECGRRAVVSVHEHFTANVVARQYHELINSLMV